MNIFKSILAVAALGLLIFNLTIIDFSDITGKESIVALIGVVACFCALLLLAILFTSKKIDKKMKEKSN
tara:strand:+ start:11535 stop:11741 length:207 start_codon:yes stop_codon:yes gene_type:complete